MKTKQEQISSILIQVERGKIGGNKPVYPVYLEVTLVELLELLRVKYVTDLAALKFVNWDAKSAEYFDSNTIFTIEFRQGQFSVVDNFFNHPLIVKAPIQGNLYRSIKHYNPSIKEAILDQLDLRDLSDEELDKVIRDTERRELFGMVCTYEGFINYSNQIIDWIEEIFDVSLEG